MDAKIAMAPADNMEKIIIKLPTIVISNNIFFSSSPLYGRKNNAGNIPRVIK